VLLDFGLARLRQAEPGDVDAGGTPAFMAPEQLRDGRVDARSDVFAVGLVLVALLTGWRAHERARAGAAPRRLIADPHLRAVLARALALEPRERYPSAAELAAALAREAAAPRPPRPPFVHLASLTEADAERLCGRDRERALLVDHVAVPQRGGGDRAVGRRQDLAPARRAGAAARAARRPRGSTPRGARRRWRRSSRPSRRGRRIWRGALDRRAPRRGRVVVVIDQVEALFLDDGPELTAMLALVRAPAPEVAVVLSVREDFLARLLDRPELVGAPAPVVRIGPLTRDAAEQALRVAPGRAADRGRAGADRRGPRRSGGRRRGHGPRARLGRAPAVFPPHLQLVGAALYDALPADAHG
jgi:hypothetical protein